MTLFFLFYALISWAASIYWGFTWGFTVNSGIGWQVLWSLIATAFFKLILEGIGILIAWVADAGSESRRYRRQRGWSASPRPHRSMSAESAGKSLEKRYRLKREGLARGLAIQEANALQTEAVVYDVDAEKVRLEERIRTARPLPPPD